MRILQNMFLAFLIVPCASKAQSLLGFPLEGPISLTGNYAEVRPNHFHAGLDFKTHPEKNLPVYAVAPGYVSRIKVSTHGYGKVLYITHPNGHVSVYGHQYAFNETIKKYVEGEQVKQETFEIELFPKAHELPIKKGDIIGYSGNTGDSEGPHLHFEVRDERTEVPLNPLRFLKVADTIAPVINAVVVYGDDYETPRLFKVSRKTDTVPVDMKFGVGVECYDQETFRGNKNNVYKIEVLLDGALYHTQVLDSIAFDLARYVNTYCDQEVKRKLGIKVQKCFVGKNNELPIYRTTKNGFVFLNDTFYHKLTVRIFDFYKQSAEVRMIIKRKPATKQNPLIPLPVNCLEDFKKNLSTYTIEMPARSLYKDVAMRDSFSNGALYFYAKDYNVPLHRSCTLGIKPAATMAKFGEKLCLVEVSGKEKNYAGGELTDGFVKATVKNFGVYKIHVDTIAPKIKYVKPKKAKAYRKGSMIFFKVSDELSGIGRFKLTVNDVFQLAEYEHKIGMIFFTVKENTPKGKVKVKLELFDRKNNRSASEVSLMFE